MTDNPLTLTLDIGTSSTRALLWDTEGREIAGLRAQIPYQMHTTHDGGVEMPAEELFGYVARCLDQILSPAGDRAASIRAVGISTFWHSLLGLDANGAPLTPIYNWSDTRSASAARKLRATMDEAAVHARTGCVIHPSYYPAKLTWLRETQRDLFGKVARWASPSEYLFGRLFGPEAVRVSVSIASGTGVFNQQRCEWDDDTLSALDLPVEKLSTVANTKEPAQGLPNELAARWPVLKSVPFYHAYGDGACGNIGSGCVTPERFAINLGTSGAIRVVWNESATGGEMPAPGEPPQGLWRYRVDRNRPVIGGAFSDGGLVYAWMCRTLQLPQGDLLEQELAAMEPGAHGLSFLPFLSGERSTGWNPDARASLIGLTQDTRPIDILRASMEAVALRFGLAARLLRGPFPLACQIIASGGALGSSPVWSQMFADALGQPVTLTAEPEASSRGAALLAMEAHDLIANAQEPQARLAGTFAPDAGRHARYQEMLDRQQRLYAQLV